MPFYRHKPWFFQGFQIKCFDSVIVSKCDFSNSNGVLFSLNDEKDKKGYYIVEHFIITGNTITNLVGQLLTFFKSGNDESIMGMSLLFANNKISNSNAEENNAPFISLTGVQKSIIENNTFSNCHESKMIIEYKDFVGARHIFHTNFSKKSDTIDANKYEIAKENRFE